jgi:alcohol dehydrogenase
VHGEPVTLHLEDLWISNITVTTGLVNGTTIAMLIDLVATGKIDATLFGTHTFGLDQMIDAYDVFGHADTYDALKVVISR